MPKLSVNSLANAIFEKILAAPDEYGVEVTKFGNGGIVVDASRGSYDVGLLMGEICMGGLGRVELTMEPLGGVPLPSVVVHTSHPKVSCLGSQYAGWNVSVKKQVGEKVKKKKYMASGPARALARVEKELYEELAYADDADVAVIVVESAKLPDEAAVDVIAQKCGVVPANVRVICAPTASIPGSVQIAARIVETSIHKLHELHFDLDAIRYGVGVTSIAPVAKNDLIAMGRTNDSIIYGGRVYLTVDVPKDQEAAMEETLAKAPSNKSSSYGKPFYDTFKEVEFDFFKIDGALFAPAVLTVNNMQTGKTFSAGEVNEAVLKASYAL